MNDTEAMLVADIGGTNARFALARRDRSGPLQLDRVRLLTVAEHPTLGDAVKAYLADAGGRPATAVFAVASPVQNDQIKFTNSPWTFSVAGLRADLGLPGLRFINDFSALSMALPHLQGADLEPVGERLPHPGGAQRSYAVLGPGTGLGVGGLLIRGGRPVVIESEGGHLAFAPSDAYEIEILRRLLKDFDRVSCERLISGAGLLRLYRTMCDIEGVAAEHEQPADVTAAADVAPDSLCAQAVLRFCAIFGAVAGDVAMAFGAWDGVFLGGGISSKLSAWLRRSEFRTRFEAKGRHRGLMHSIPTVVIRHPQAGLLGAAAFADQLDH